MGALERSERLAHGRTGELVLGTIPGESLERLAEAGAGHARILGGAEDGREEPGGTRLEIAGAEGVQPGGPLLALVDDAGLAQHLEVMRAGRLRDGDVEAAAGLMGHDAHCTTTFVLCYGTTTIVQGRTVMTRSRSAAAVVAQYILELAEPRAASGAGKGLVRVIPDGAKAARPGSS